MPKEQDILEALPELLAELSGLQPELIERRPTDGADSVIRLAGQILVIEAKSNARPGVLSQAAQQVASQAREYGPHAVPLLAVPFMGEAGRRICEEAGVAYVDLSGNAHIKSPPLLIHVQGRPNRFKHRGRPSSVFAPKSSRITRLMLLEPARWWSQHELADVGELGAGYVSRICGRLEGDRLIERNAERAVRPREPKLLLQAWLAEYRFQKHHVIRGHVSARSGDELAERVGETLGRSRIRYALTGLAAAWHLAPFAGFRMVAVYIESRPEESLLGSLKWHEAPKGANLWFVKPNDEGVFQGAIEVSGLNCVSAVQAYLDLAGMPERSDEAAAHLREELLPWA